MPDHKDTILTKFYINGTEVKGINLDSVPIPDGQTEDKDVHYLGLDRFKRKAPDMYDPGSCDIKGLYMPADPGQVALNDAFLNVTECTFQVVLTESGVTYQYNGYVTKYSPGSDSNTAMFNGTILATGIFTSTTTEAGVTKIEATTGTVLPTHATTAVAATDRDIVVTELTATTTDKIKVTAADADFIGYTLNGGVTWTTLTSGTASGDLTLGAAGSVTKIVIKVEEENKANRYFNILFARA